MEASVEEALRAKEIAEKRFAERDYAGAMKYASKAKTLCPGLEGITQMVATFDVYAASGLKSNGEIDYYSVLGLHPSADRKAVKKQYRKMAALLHPDKNKTVGADGAFKLVSEAGSLLSDNYKRSSYDLKRSKQFASCVVQMNVSSDHAPAVPGYNNYSNSSNSSTLNTFWTICTSCKVQYEYLRKYVNKRLSCKNCRGTFIAVETGTAPVNGSFPYSSWSSTSSISYGSPGYDGVTYVPTTTTLYTGNGVSGLHATHGYEYASNASYQWGSYSSTSAAPAPAPAPNESYVLPNDHVYQVNGNEYRAKANGKRSTSASLANTNSNVSVSYNGPFLTKAGLPDKRRKVVVGATFRNGYEDKGPTAEVKLANGSANADPKLSSELPTRAISCAPAFDARKLLIDKAKNAIRKKLEEMRLASESAAAAAAAAFREKAKYQAIGAREKPRRAGSDASGHQIKPAKAGAVSITVPDPDFHDFDKDRSEECFKPKQIWALYDEDDGMPRLYCLIRQVVSTTPFKILITYLNSKTDSEFGSVNWLDSGFTKSCGHFRAFNSDEVDRVNIFSHLLKGEKAARGGCVRIFPKSGDIWAIYRNWSTDWNRSTPDDVRHQYEMVEVLDDYSENLGVCVAPLVKLAGFKTVYQRDTNKDAIRWIPRREMLRFSHQVPSWSLDGEASNLPDKCWDLDPAATPDELLHSVTETMA